jgi:hypothetical protein
MRMVFASTDEKRREQVFALKSIGFLPLEVFYHDIPGFEEGESESLAGAS